jgi:glycolate oxidase iron-sulfur subunit
MLKDFKNEINKCSKCGMCQAVCPVYKETGNDCAVSRGKFVMLDGVLKGDLKLNRNINKYLDLCLKCGKCKKFCPSSIDVCTIFENAKYEYVKNTIWGNFVFLLESKLVFGNVLKLVKIFNNFFKRNNTNSSLDLTKVLYFKGCVNNVFPKTDKFLQKIPNIEIIERDFDCCGLPFLSSGNLKRFEEVKNYNLNLMNCRFDYILTDCASCESTLKSYFSLQDEEKQNSFISLGSLILKQGMKFKFKKPIKVTFHKPCHLENDDFLKPLLANCENVEFIEMENYDDCCGFAGEFAIKNPKISIAISKKKAKNILNTGADYCITTCPACILGLKQGLFGCKNAPKVLSLADFLNKAEQFISGY